MTWHVCETLFVVSRRMSKLPCHPSNISRVLQKSY